MRQGEIWYADLNPVKGSAQAGFRPVVIISGNMLNKYLNVVITVPLTTKIKHYQATQSYSPTTQTT
ncbi:type II toxin-antitoxin system PemK/MazF family toxin [Nitritalea halalkaliphila]|uniref:type II toxin-antitoxin system PemK/MazF family toxin n=1 Tax=Nitritalea halalkaliphila TaxID=590849 RepID=UPI001EE64807|nr:type II toxin-antitoxin system PemK/MazF family toxin [Nitritalea halalkaliphila]